MNRSRRTTPTRPTRGRVGFTLLEMLVVLIIMGLMVAFVAPRVVGYVSGGRVTTTKAQIGSLAAAIERFHLDVGRHPTEEEGLQALVQRPQSIEESVWKGPYLEKDFVPLDGWDREFLYLFDDNGRFVVRSLGADGRPGGEGENADLDNRTS